MLSYITKTITIIMAILLNGAVLFGLTLVIITKIALENRIYVETMLPNLTIPSFLFYTAIISAIWFIPLYLMGKFEIGISGILYLNGYKKQTAILEAQSKPHLRSLCQQAGLDADKFNLLVHFDKKVNAFAIGKNNISINTGLLKSDQKIIKGILAHELGHLVSGHGSFNYILMCLCLPIMFVQWIIGTVFQTLNIFSKIPLIGFVFNLLSLVWMLLTFCFTLIFNDTLAFTNKIYYRNCEHAADEFAVKIGCGAELHSFFQEQLEKHGDIGFWDSMFSTHPSTYKRLMNVDKNIKKYASNNCENTVPLNEIIFQNR
ncbi:MAG: M48 family metalloprotease [Bacillota bacterium]